MDEFIIEELGAYSFGMLIHPEEGELIQFDYTGEEIRIWYHVEGWAPGIISEFGLIFLVDGLPQQVRLETKEGMLFQETSYLQRFALEYREKIEFYVVFMPISGEQGKTSGIMATHILRPDFMPESKDKPSFEGFHSPEGSFPMQLNIYNEIENMRDGYLASNMQPISQEILDFHREWLYEGETIEEFLAEFPRLALFPYRQELQMDYQDEIVVNDGIFKVSLFVYGGQEVRSRITFFVNHEPVFVNGYNFIEIEMKSGQMLLIDVELTVEDLEQYNSLYAIMMTTGEDYLMQGMYGTQTLLLINN